MKILTLISLLGLVASPPQTAVVFVGDVQLEDSAIFVNGKAYLPVRGVAESLGADVDYDKQAQRITVLRHQRPTSLFELMIAAKKQELDPSDVMRNERAEMIVSRIVRDTNRIDRRGAELVSVALKWRDDPWSLRLSLAVLRGLEAGITSNVVEKNEETMSAIVDVDQHLSILIAWHERR